MDSNERDDVPLAKLLKKGLFSKFGSTAPSSPVPSPTDGIAENVEPNDNSAPAGVDPNIVHIRGSMFKISPDIINGFLGNTVVSCSPSSHPSDDVLAPVLSGGTLSMWSENGIPVVSLSVKYVILHKIGIATTTI
ncbi:uncharacterized protein E5676_scaffold602G001820 [Cucumis melo var. makuwa]|uniref:Uncharacterized protein n=1 Tax=Cucumis melo var. makuwa TaxID=1194695 RepID=A0A5A7TG54_CUCMM|nr:uncharacterized protein E6C27_scaffold943G00130 [Cucumis melo var. makuwa]TYK00988.1 uncharacterized protein E5676_scaffold602G001820 [Cucumis melo var. makuwa]